MRSVSIIQTEKRGFGKLQVLEPVEFKEGESIPSRKPQSRRSIVRISPDKRFQTILGIGYSFEHSSCYNLLQLSPQDRRTTLEMFVDPKKGAGMTLWRLSIGTSDFTGTDWYSYEDLPPGQEDLNLDQFSIARDHELIIPVVKEALAINPDLVFFASPWSPPGWMKDSAQMCGGRLLPKYYPVYARYLVKFVQAYEALGIPIHAITVQNEPRHESQKMPTCRWTAEEERDFIRDHLGPAFQEAGLLAKTRIWCYDHNFGFLKIPTTYPSTILSDPGASQYVEGVGFHHYGGRPHFMTKIMAEFPDKKAYFTEGSVFGIRGTRKIARYLLNGACSYNGWVCFIDTEHKPNNGPFFCMRTLL